MKILLFVLLAFSWTSPASDHIDGPVTTKHPISDLADFYFFPSPSGGKKVVLVMNTYFAAYSENHFNEGIVYQFHLAETQINREKKNFDHQNQQTISCYFTVPKNHRGQHDHQNHHISCEIGEDQIIAGHTEEIISHKDARLFAGLRSDPFFFNMFWVASLLKNQADPGPYRSDTMQNLNALSIVLELDLNMVFPDSNQSIFAASVSALSLKADNKTVEKQLDWIGRPEITNITMAKMSGEDLRDSYNQHVAPFSMPSVWTQYHDKVYQNLQFFDEVDAKQDWSIPDGENLVMILMNDSLVLDLSKPCLDSRSNYLHIEKSLLASKPHKGCGGRRLEDDFIDVMVSYYVQGSSGSDLIVDGIYAPHKPVLSEFPYLNEPEISWAGWTSMKSKRALNWALGWWL